MGLPGDIVPYFTFHFSVACTLTALRGASVVPLHQARRISALPTAPGKRSNARETMQKSLEIILKLESHTLRSNGLLSMGSTTTHPTKVLNKCMPWSCNAGLPYVWHCQAGGYPFRLGAIVSSALLKAIATNHRLAILSHKMANFQIFFFCTDPCKRLLSSLKMRLVGVVIHGLPLLLKIFTSVKLEAPTEQGSNWKK